MAVLKQTSPTAWPVAPKPCPSSTVPSASTSRAVALGSVQAVESCLLVMSRLHSRGSRRRQSAQRRPMWKAEYGRRPMDLLTAFGLFAVTAMLAFYALEDRGPAFVLGFAGACL